MTAPTPAMRVIGAAVPHIAATLRLIAAATALFLAGLVNVPSARAADAYTQLGAGLRDREHTEVEVHGYFRSRFAALHNLDLDRGVSPDGTPLYPVPLHDPTGQWLTDANMRLRTDLSLFAPRAGIVIRTRIDVLDNVGYGSQAVGAPTVTTQQVAEQPLSLRRLYGEVALPFGVLAMGRMANTWGSGMLANGGDGLDQDSADSVDRIAFVTPLVGHVWAVAYDIAASGPSRSLPSGPRAVDAARSDDVRGLTLAVVRGVSGQTIKRRNLVEREAVDWGAFVSRRWQSLQSSASGTLSGSALPATMARDFDAWAGDVWLRISAPSVVIEAEAAALTATYGQPSLVAGVRYRVPLHSTQLGAMLRARIGDKDGLFAQVVAAIASGDPNPGMGYAQPLTGAAPSAGDLHGPQADLPRDARIDNFRFHSDFRLDRILFREIIGGVTDATVVSVTAGYIDRHFGAGTLTAKLTAVGSWAQYASSTPGGAPALGVELDPTVGYVSDDGFALQLQYAALLPLAGLDNPGAGQSATVAQLWRCVVGYTF